MRLSGRLLRALHSEAREQVEAGGVRYDVRYVQQQETNPRQGRCSYHHLGFCYASLPLVQLGMQELAKELRSWAVPELQATQTHQLHPDITEVHPPGHIISPVEQDSLTVRLPICACH
jgi:hypothetical protein